MPDSCSRQSRCEPALIGAQRREQFRDRNRVTRFGRETVSNEAVSRSSHPVLLDAPSNHAKMLSSFNLDSLEAKETKFECALAS